MSDQAYADALPAQYRLHWYVLEGVLGQGGFGITYLARDTNLDQPVAIKEYLPVDVATRRADSTVRSRTGEHAERYRWGLDRFIREARTLARFDHPNIVRVHSVFEANNTAYMVMRFEEGENLAALLERRRTLPEEELRRIVLALLDGLELVHHAGFIHRDIKPENIHIRADGSPVLLDFGSARVAHGDARTVTVLVAPGYAPFEQYYSSGENQGPWTDIYGLGATCYRAIAGIEPVDAITRSRTELYQDKRDALLPAATVGDGLYSASFLKAIDHALAFAEKDRPQSIAQWREELASDLVPPALSTQASATPVTTLAPVPGGATHAARRPVRWASLGGAIAVATLVLWLAPPGRDEPPPAPSPVAPAVDASPARAPVKEPEQEAAAEERRRREAQDAAAREAERVRREALEAKVATLEAHVRATSDAVRKAEAARLRDAERARLEAEKRAQAEAERRRQEQARLAEAARLERDRAARQADEVRKAEAVRRPKAPAEDTARKTTPAPAPPSMASLAGTAPPAAISAKSTLPPAGMAWTYAVIDHVFKRKRPAITIRVLNSDSARVEEIVTTDVPGIGPNRRVLSVHDTNIVQLPLGGSTILVESAPYLLVADEEGALFQSSPIKGYPRGARSLPEWNVSAASGGWQQITVAAGSFRALRVVITGEREFASGGVMWGQSGRFEIVAWYAPKVKRLVKLENKSWELSSGRLIGHDVMELISFRPPA